MFQCHHIILSPIYVYGQQVSVKHHVSICSGAPVPGTSAGDEAADAAQDAVQVHPGCLHRLAAGLEAAGDVSGTQGGSTDPSCARPALLRH